MGVAFLWGDLFLRGPIVPFGSWTAIQRAPWVPPGGESLAQKRCPRLVPGPGKAAALLHLAGLGPGGAVVLRHGRG